MTAIRPADPIVVDVIFDLACPWCFIGKRQLAFALRLRPKLTTQVRWWPFLLNPDIPADGIDHATYLLHKFGSRERGARVCRAIEEVGGGVGIAFAFGRIRRAPNTLAAHRLVHIATKLERDPSAMVDALFTAHFVEARDIGAIEVLVDIGRAAGLDGHTLEAYLRGGGDAAWITTRNAQAHRLGINGVPAFIFAGSYTICGAQDPSVLARLLDVARESAHAFATVNSDRTSVSALPTHGRPIK